MLKKRNNARVFRPQVTTNITNITNTINATNPTNSTNSNNLTNSTKCSKLFYCIIAITITICINISIVIYINFKPDYTYTAKPDNLADNQTSIIISSDYYTKTIIYGDETATIDSKHPIIKVTLPQYEADIHTDKSYTESNEITKTTKTLVKVADITYIYVSYTHMTLPTNSHV